MEIETSINHPDEVAEDTQDHKEEVHTDNSYFFQKRVESLSFRIKQKYDFSVE